MRHPRALAAGVLAGLALAIALATTLAFRHDAQERDHARRDAARVAAQVLRSQIAATVERTQDVAGLFGASRDVTSREFDRYVEPMLAPTAANAFGFAALVERGERASTERALGGPFLRLGADRRLRTAGRRARYLPILRIRTAGRGRPVRGLDLLGDPTRGPAASAALRTGRPQASSPVRFASTGKLGVIFYVPAYDARGELLGVAFGSFAVGPVVGRIADQLPEGTAFAIAQGGRRFGAAGRLRAVAHDERAFAGTRWRVAVSAPPGPGLGWGWLTLLVGGLLLALVGVTLVALLTQTARVARLADQRERERDAAEGRRRATQAQFANAFAHAPVGMVVLDREGRVQRANAAYAHLVGSPVEALLGDRSTRLLHPDDLAGHRPAIARLHAGEVEALHLEARLVRPDGELRWVAIHLTEFGEADRVMLAHVADITERKAIERQREALLEASHRQAERLRELDGLRDEFVALATHELRSPLTTIAGYVDLLLEDRERMPADHAAFLDTIARTSRQLLELATDLLDLTRLQDPGTRLELAPLSLAGVVREVADALAPQAATKRLALDVEVAAGAPVLGDAVALRQATTNLVANAIKYTPEGGSIALEVAAEAGEVRLSVRDDGIGIPADERHRLFERFFRASSATDRQIHGSGLGLAITKEIAEGHGGRLEVAHHAPGTTFALVLPALPRPASRVDLDLLLPGDAPRG